MTTLNAATSTGDLVGYARAGNSTGVPAAGSWTGGEPFAGYTIDTFLVNASSASISFVGDTGTDALVASFTVNGNVYTMTSGTVYGGGSFTEYPLTRTGPVLVNGVAYTVVYKQLPASDVMLMVDPTSTSGASFSPSLPAAVSGKRALTTTHRAGTDGAKYMALRVARAGAVYPPFAFFGLAAAWYDDDGAQVAVNNTAYALGVYDASIPETYQTNITGAAPTTNPEVIEAYWDEGTDVWRMVFNGGLNAQRARGDAQFDFNYFFLNTYEASWDLYNVVVMQRVPNEAERGGIRQLMVEGPGVIAPVFTSSDTVYNREGTLLRHQIKIDKTIASVDLSGTDSALFAVNGSFQLTFLGDSLKSYDTPDDADTNRIYVLTLDVTDTETGTASQPITVTLQRSPAFTPKDLWGNLDNSRIDFMGEDDPASVIINKEFFPAVVASDPLYIGVRAPSGVYLGVTSVPYVGPRTFFP